MGQQRYGARVFLIEPGVAVIKQTVRREGRFVVDWAGGDQHEEFVDLADDRAVARALRRAIAGRL